MEDIILNSKITIPSTSLTFKFSRSSGKGGQNVNKVSTKVELLFSIDELRTSDEIRSIIKGKLRNRFDSEGIVRIVSQESRSQWQNKRIAIDKLSDMILRASFVDRHRVATKPTRSSKIRRVDGKKIDSKRKELRRKNINRSED
ncbi:MAG: alternative ribosome rescue aminoacyl-tRNA hydrolase ArfB [Bacteroidota bacterium]|nr:alternative ribosome rescue aminoacyl-tRNA hydrolase ArfB [Bacteroidota bacterium]